MPLHRTDPAVDREREGLVRDLKSTGKVEEAGLLQLVDPQMSENEAGDVFFTDGKAEVVYLSK